MPQITLHPLLQYSHRDAIGSPCSPILWDIRDPPTSSVRLCKNNKIITRSKLSDFATNPPVPFLTVTCGVLPYPWRIESRNPRGISILDLLEAIYRVVHTRIRPDEWNHLSEKHQDRVGMVFEQRWMTSAEPWNVRGNGVSRADCLLQSTGFAGLSMLAYDQGNVSCILTLSRNSRY